MPSKIILGDASEKDLAKLRNKAWRMKYLYSVKNRQGKIVPYIRNAAQEHFTKNRWYFNIVLKARRLGFSTEIELSLLDDVLFNPWDGLVIAHTKEDGMKIFEEKIMTAWNNLSPPEMRTLWDVDTQRANMLKFDWGEEQDPLTKQMIRNYSSISVSNSGRSGGFTRVHISEFGKICALYPLKAEEIMSGTIPTIPYGGQLDIESTAEGDYGYFHDLFWEAWNNPRPNDQMRKNEFRAHFYNWTWDKEEIARILKPVPKDQMDSKDFFIEYQEKYKLTDMEISYYYLKWKSLGKSFRTLKQEYPTTPEEAFATSGDKFFEPDNLALQQPYLKDPIRKEGPWRIFKEPNPMHNYALGIDASEGIGGDNATIAIIDFSTKPAPEIVATFKNNYTPPDMLAYEAKVKGLLYNTAFIIPEINNHGHVVVNTLREIYPLDQIYTQQRKDKLSTEETEKLGFQTNISTKSQMFSDLNTAINEKALHIVDKDLFMEFKTFPRQKINQTSTKDDGTLGHWDLLTATALAFQGRDRLGGYSETVTTYNVNDNYNPNSHFDSNGIYKDDEKWYNKENNTNHSDFNPFDPI